MQLGIVTRLFGGAATPDIETVSPEGATNSAAAFAAVLAGLRGATESDATRGTTEPVDAESIDVESVNVETAGTAPVGAESVDVETAGTELANTELAETVLAEAVLTETDLKDLESGDAEPAAGKDDEILALLFSSSMPGVAAPRTLQRAGESQEGAPADAPTHVPSAPEATKGADVLLSVTQAEPSTPQSESEADDESQPQRSVETSEARSSEVRSFEIGPSVASFSKGNSTGVTGEAAPVAHILRGQGGNPEVSVAGEAAPVAHGRSDAPELPFLHDEGAEPQDVAPGSYPAGQLETGASTTTDQASAVHGADNATGLVDLEAGAEFAQADGEIEGEVHSETSFQVSSPDSQTPSSADSGSGESEQEEHAAQHVEPDPSPAGTHSPESAEFPLTTEKMGESVPIENIPAVDTPVLAEAVQENQHRAEAADQPDRPAPATGQAQPLFARPATAAAWLRSMLAHHSQDMGQVEGWQVLNVKLDGEQGSVTVKARREEEKVSISVGFTDPGTRAMVQANAQRIEQTLEAQYQTSVDLSFFTGSEERGGAGDEPRQGPEMNSGKALPPSVEHTPVATHRPRPATALREWVV